MKPFCFFFFIYSCMRKKALRLLAGRSSVMSKVVVVAAVAVLAPSARSKNFRFLLYLCVKHRPVVLIEFFFVQTLANFGPLVEGHCYSFGFFPLFFFSPVQDDVKTPGCVAGAFESSGTGDVVPAQLLW